MCKQTYEICLVCGNQSFGLFVGCGKYCAKFDITAVNYTCPNCGGPRHSRPPMPEVPEDADIYFAEPGEDTWAEPRRGPESGSSMRGADPYGGSHGYGREPAGHQSSSRSSREPQGYGREPQGYEREPQGYGREPQRERAPSGYGREPQSPTSYRHEPESGSYGRERSGSHGYGREPPSSSSYGREPQGYGRERSGSQAQGRDPHASSGYGREPESGSGGHRLGGRDRSGSGYGREPPSGYRR